MATRTIANGGGNYNATGTWVEGIVPTSADLIVGTATSGQLTINVASAAANLDLTAYTNTITFNNTWTVNGAGLTSNIGASTAFAGTNQLIFGQTHTISQNGGTNRIPHLRMNTSSTKTLNSDLYCTNFSLQSNAPVLNGNTIFVNGNFGDNTTGSVGALYQTGTSNFTLDGSGYVSYQYAGTGTVTINTSGSYNTVGVGMLIGAEAVTSTATFNFLSGTTPTLFNTTFVKRTGVNNTYTTNIIVPHNVFVLNSAVASTNINLTLNTTSGITCNLFASTNNPRFYTSDSEVPDVYISGGSLSAQTLNLSSTYRMPSASTNPPAAGSFVYKGITLRLDPAYTHYFNVMKLSGGGIPARPAIRSTTSSAVSVVLGDKETSQITDYNFYDINASGGEQIVAINASTSGTTNVTTTYPSGGGSAGGSFTFVN